jgi:UDP-2,4-diacetamido-2,4,6-trideoxy-beta-L-altropyranose hydrolase
MKLGILLIRADASLAIGTGHVMRCLALAQAWRDAGEDAIFAMAEATLAVEDRLRGEGFEVARTAVGVGSADDAEETSRLAREHGASWAVVDGYRFGAEFQARLKNSSLKVLFIDDYGHARHYSADLVLNQNAHAREAFYPSRDASTRLLLGPRFAMLRHEFTSWRGWKREIPAVARRVLVTMGGSDPDNVTELVVNAILKAGGFEATIVAGGSNPHLARLREFAGQSDSTVRLVENASNMPELIARADVAVAGAGTTSWEMCFLGLPALLIVLADNQEGVAEELGKNGVMVNLGRAHDLTPITIATQLQRLADSPVIRREMSERGRALVDGRGAERVVSAMKGEALSIRPVEERDCKLLWEWANDPVVRASAFSSEPIPWNEHVAWFRAKLNDRNCVMFVALNASAVPVGQIRFDKRGVSDSGINIDIDGAAHERGARQFHALVKTENVASGKAFEKAGFKAAETMMVKGQTATHYVYVRAAK